MKKLLFLIITLISIFSLSSCNKVSLNSEKNIDDKIILTKRNAISSDGKTISVTATINPSTAIDKECIWSLVYADGSSSTYINNYVTYSVSTDTLTCTLTKKKTFLKQMKLICTLKSNSTISAYCFIDSFDNGANFHTDCFDFDLSSNNLRTTYLSQLFVGVYNPFDSSLYDTYGGTVDTTVKNVKIIDSYLDYDFEVGCFDQNDFYNTSIYDIIDGEVERFDYTIANLRITCDLYYGSKLIISGVETGIEFYLALS